MKRNYPSIPLRYNKAALRRFLKNISVLSQVDTAELLGLPVEKVIEAERTALAKILNGLEELAVRRVVYPHTLTPDSVGSEAPNVFDLLHEELAVRDEANWQYHKVHTAPPNFDT